MYYFYKLHWNIIKIKSLYGYTSLLVSEGTPVSWSVWLGKCSLCSSSDDVLVAMVTLFFVSLLVLELPVLGGGALPLLLWWRRSGTACLCWVLEELWWDLACRPPLPLSLSLPPPPPLLLLLLLLLEEKSSLKRPRRDRSSFHVRPQPNKKDNNVCIITIHGRGWGDGVIYLNLIPETA